MPALGASASSNLVLLEIISCHALGATLWDGRLTLIVFGMGKACASIIYKLSRTIFDCLRGFLFRVLSIGPIPEHIAVIMDGNRRFARTRNLKPGEGHQAGFLALVFFLQYCYELGVKFVTVYAFSIDNFNRRPDEVQYIMDLMLEKIEGFLKEESFVNKYGIKVNFFGNLNLLSAPMKIAAEKVMAATAKNTTVVFSLCVAYSSTDELVHAAQELQREKLGEIQQDNLEGEEDMIECGSDKGLIRLMDLERHMYTAGCPDPDILIRTAGETRLSNFLLWQTSSCHLTAPEVLWPNLSIWYLVWAILEYQQVQPYLEKIKAAMTQTS